MSESQQADLSDEMKSITACLFGKKLQFHLKDHLFIVGTLKLASFDKDYGLLIKQSGNKAFQIYRKDFVFLTAKDASLCINEDNFIAALTEPIGVEGIFQLGYEGRETTARGPSETELARPMDIHAGDPFQLLQDDVMAPSQPAHPSGQGMSAYVHGDPDWQPHIPLQAAEQYQQGMGSSNPLGDQRGQGLPFMQQAQYPLQDSVTNVYPLVALVPIMPQVQWQPPVQVPQVQWQPPAQVPQVQWQPPAQDIQAPYYQPPFAYQNMYGQGSHGDQEVGVAVPQWHGYRPPGGFHAQGRNRSLGVRSFVPHYRARGDDARGRNLSRWQNQWSPFRG